MSQKTIAILKSDLGTHGGLEKYCKRIAEALVQYGYKVFLLTAGEVPQGELPYTVHSLTKRSKWSFWHLLRFDRAAAAWLSKNKVDYVFGMDRNFCGQHFYRAGNGVHAAYLEHRKAYTSFWKRCSFFLNPLHFLIRSMEKKTYTSSTLQRLFVNSEMVRDELVHYYPEVDPAKICAVHNGVEWYELGEFFTNSCEDERNSAYQFLFIGNEYERKGLLLLLQALTLVRKPYELTVIGKERCLARYKAYAQKLGIDRFIHFLGQQKNVRPYYQKADAIVIPSYYDPFANVTVEALAMGLFVVSSPKNGGKEVLTHDTMGVVFDAFTPASVAHALEIAMQRPKTRKTGAAIRNAVQHLDFSHQIGKLIRELSNYAGPDGPEHS